MSLLVISVSVLLMRHLDRDEMCCLSCFIKSLLLGSGAVAEDEEELVTTCDESGIVSSAKRNVLLTEEESVSTSSRSTLKSGTEESEWNC